MEQNNNPDAYEQLQTLLSKMHGDEAWGKLASILALFMEEQGLQQEALAAAIKPSQK